MECGLKQTLEFYFML